ncbi:MAG: hypothetical protein J07HQW2_03859 [Haloquadratum walsbyi J07HQW2]|uniref:Uncharacterized protein n=1 Tax=Haloquadratum walsbyi J07HQW2 TaxID=1238425 RepID=U1NK98_9EURY|nr:MAG: hypothetical protein J07HQW2_03859 [Haloquadratum walsbyi J07HQW2]
MFQPNLDVFRDLRRERLEVLAVLVVDVGVRVHPDGVDDPVDDAPAAGFQPLFRRQQNLASERVDRLVTLDTTELRVAEPLIAEAGDEDPLQRSRPTLEFCQSVLVGVVPFLLATDGRLDLVASVDDRLQHVDEVAPVVTDRVPEAGDVVAVAVAVTPDDVRRNVPGTDDVRIQRGEVEFVDVLVEADLGRENEAAAVGVVERPHRLVELVTPGVPRHENAAVVGLADLDRGEHVPDRRPRELLDGLFRARHEVEDAVEVRLPVEERVRLVDDRPAGHVVPRRRVTDAPVARVRRPARKLLVVDVRPPTQREVVDAGVRRHLVEGRDDLARRADQDIWIVCLERPLDGGQDIRRRAGDGVAGNGQLPIGVGARFGHRNAEPEGRQLARRRRIDTGLQTVPELSREVDVEAGEIPDWIGRQLARLPGEWSDAIDVGNVDCENGLLVSSKAGASRNYFGRDDVRVLVVHRLERREIEIGVRVARGDVETRGVLVSFCYDGTVGGRLPL